MDKQQRVYTFLFPAVIEDLKKESAKTGLPVSAIIRVAVLQYLYGDDDKK